MNSIKLGTIATLALAASSFATTINGSSLQTVLNNITVSGTSSVNVNADQVSPDQYWNLTASGTSAATMIIEIAGFSGSNTFGVYDVADASKKVQLFSGAASAGAKVAVSLDADNNVSINFASTGVQFASSTFGYYLSGPGGTFYSDATLNGDAKDHMVAFQGKGDLVQLPSSPKGTWTPDEYVLAWEDVAAGADFDYDDMVVMVESVKPVPEPTTMGLMGLGLLGLVAAARRRRK